VKTKDILFYIIGVLVIFLSFSIDKNLNDMEELKQVLIMTIFIIFILLFVLWSHRKGLLNWSKLGWWYDDV